MKIPIDIFIIFAIVITMKSDKTIIQLSNEAEMAGFIKANGTACRFVSMLSKTPVTKMSVKNPWHKLKDGKVVGECGLFKLSRKTGIINANYNSSVRRRIAERLGVTFSEVEYENGEVYYEHLMTLGDSPKALPLVQHANPDRRNGLMLQYFPHKSTNCYVDAAGNIVPDEQVKKYLYAEAARVPYKPTVIAIYLRNITQLSASGVLMVAEDYEEAEQALEEATK